MRVYVDGIGILGPGLVGWEPSRVILAGDVGYHETPSPDPPASILPPNERRRSSACVRWAVQVAQEAIEQAEADPKTLATVFACSDGEMDILNQLCTTLAMSERVVSPTLFHQSVHNAAAGYWSIATRCQQSSTALSCYDWSFGSGLLEAAAYVCTEEKTVLLVAYDLPPPIPLYAARPLHGGFAAALVLARTAAPCSLAQLDLTLSNDRSGEATGMADPRLEALRSGNPAARSLPLLAAIARRRAAGVRLEYLEDQHLLVQVMPCRS
jgi:hypothetical protein